MTRKIIGSIKLEPDATAPTAAAGVVYFDSGDTKLKVCEDGANFVDVGSALEIKEVDGAPDVTSVKTIRVTNGTLTDDGGGQVTISTGGQMSYDAIFDPSGSGDYTTLGAAITGGAIRILLKGNTTETGNITLPANCVIHGYDGFELVNMQTNLLTTGLYNVLDNFYIRSTRTSAQIIIGGDTCLFSNMTLQNNGTTNPASPAGVVDDNNVARGRVIFDNCWIQMCNNTVDMANRIGIYSQNSGSQGWRINNTEFVGQTLSYQCVVFSLTGRGTLINNVYVRNVGEAAIVNMVIGGHDNQLNNIYFANNCAGIIQISGDNNNITNLTNYSPGLDIQITGDFNCLSNINTLGGLTIDTGSVHNIVSSSQIYTGITINDDDNTISSTRVGAAAGGGAVTITVAAAADRTNIVGCRVDAAISDAGTDTTADYVVY
jgi:hypothetical protein